MQAAGARQRQHDSRARVFELARTSVPVLMISANTMAGTYPINQSIYIVMAQLGMYTVIRPKHDRSIRERALAALLWAQTKPHRNAPDGCAYTLKQVMWVCILSASAGNLGRCGTGGCRTRGLDSPLHCAASGGTANPVRKPPAYLATDWTMVYVARLCVQSGDVHGVGVHVAWGDWSRHERLVHGTRNECASKDGMQSMVLGTHPLLSPLP